MTLRGREKMEVEPIQGQASDTKGKSTWWKALLCILIGAVPFPLAVLLLPMSSGLSGFGMLCVPFAIGGAATYRGYRTTRSAIARGVLLTLGLLYAVLILVALLVLAAQILWK